MTILDQYVIPLKGLKDGKHTYTFEVSDKFFEYFVNSEIKKGDLLVLVVLKKIVSVIEMIINISGEVDMICDRCLDNFKLPIISSNYLLIKAAVGKKEEEADIIYISDSSLQLNIAQYIYEFIDFSLPLKRVHPEDKNGKSLCNKQMLNKINELNFKNKDNDIDPRWEDLNKIRKN